MVGAPPTGRDEQVTIDIDKKDGLLEELNLPPAAIKFMRENARNLQLVGVTLVVLVLAWTGYDYYRETRHQAATAQLQEAVQVSDLGKRVELLRGVISDYPRTDAANLAALEIAHVAYDEGRLEDAALGYGQVLDALSGGNPLRPLVLYSLAQTQELGGKPDQALTSYAKLKGHAGFAAEALLGLGRLHERQGDAAGARRAYEEINGLVGVDPSVRELAADRLASLPAPAPEQ